MEKRTDSKAPQPAVVSVSRYGDVASDLDRISSAGSTDEVLRIVNEVLGLLDRSGISEQPFVPLPSALSSASELRAVADLLAERQPESDLDFILRAVLTTALHALPAVQNGRAE